jgi:hypothetical protein
VEKSRLRAHIQHMLMHLTPADVQRAREIVAARLPMVEQSGDLAEKVALAIAVGIAEGRAQGIEEGIKRVTASNDP